MLFLVGVAPDGKRFEALKANTPPRHPKHGGYPGPQSNWLTIEKRGGEGTRLWVDDLAGLLGLVEIGAVELHPWNARIDDIERPDMLVFDLERQAGATYTPPGSAGSIVDAPESGKRKCGQDPPSAGRGRRQPQKGRTPRLPLESWGH